LYKQWIELVFVSFDGLGFPIVSLKVFEDNVLVCEFLEEKRHSRVLVVDDDDNLRSAILCAVTSSRRHKTTGG
jgi:regulator of RNase E activity RraA